MTITSLMSMTMSDAGEKSSKRQKHHTDEEQEMEAVMPAAIR